MTCYVIHVMQLLCLPHFNPIKIIDFLYVDRFELTNIRKLLINSEFILDIGMSDIVNNLFLPWKD